MKAFVLRIPETFKILTTSVFLKKKTISELIKTSVKNKFAFHYIQMVV